MRRNAPLANTNGRIVDKYYKSVYSTLFLGYLKPGKFHIGVKNETTVDADADCIFTIEVARERYVTMLIYIFLREASALSVLLKW